MLAHNPATRHMSPREYMGNLVLLIVGGNDITRNSMTGGLFAMHQHPEYVGNRLAELQLKILWAELLPRFPTIEVVGEPQRVLSNFVRGFSSMMVRLPS